MAIFLLDDDGQIRFCNQSAAMLFGQGRKKMQQQSFWQTLVYHTFPVELLDELWQHGRSFADNDVEFVFPDGRHLVVEVTANPEAAAAEGIDTVEFHVQTNPGTRPGPIMKVASGGELSRFLLALKVALADRGSAPTLVFDEIDTGVGGAVADAIGQRLKRLSGTVQVLSVTHAPQVAARAATHLLISKGPAGDGSDKIATRVATMAPENRTEEIARMLAGASVTDEARAAARSLLAGNG